MERLPVEMSDLSMNEQVAALMIAATVETALIRQVLAGEMLPAGVRQIIIESREGINSSIRYDALTDFGIEEERMDEVIKRAERILNCCFPLEERNQDG